MSKTVQEFWICDWGHTSYLESFNIQKKLRVLKIEKKIPNVFIFTDHPPVFTLGKRPCNEDFLSTKEKIESEGIEIFQSNRGGKITYHGPGQIVGYFIFDIRSLKKSIPSFVNQIEEIIILTLAELGLKVQRDSEHPGVWVQNKKIAALGLHFDRGVSMHGFSLNVNPDLLHYRHIVPCGIQGREVTSLHEEGCRIEIEKLKKLLIKNTKNIFKGVYSSKKLKEMEAKFFDQ